MMLLQQLKHRMCPTEATADRGYIRHCERPENATRLLTTSEGMGVVVGTILLCTNIAERTWTKGDHKERPVVDVEPESGEGVSLELFEITRGPYL
jgi:hypothetical protein